MLYGERLYAHRFVVWERSHTTTHVNAWEQSFSSERDNCVCAQVVVAQLNRQSRWDSFAGERVVHYALEMSEFLFGLEERIMSLGNVF